jgi:hypothetical protein
MSGKILGLAVLAALVIWAPQAEARRLYWWEAQPDQYDNPDSYDPYADSQDTTAQDMFNQQQYDKYVREMRRRHRYDPNPDRYDPALYDQGYFDGLTDPADPPYDLQPKIKKPAKPKKPKAVKAAVTKPSSDATTTVSSNPATAAPTATASNPGTPAPVVTDTKTTDTKTTGTTTPAAVDTKPTTVAQKPSKGGKVTCAKGEEIVASYGFLDISQKSCEGSSLVYSAVRGKSNFEVEVNPSNGEVTAVRKTS